MTERTSFRLEKAVLALINLTDGSAMNQLQKKTASEFTQEAAAALMGKRSSAATARQNRKAALGNQFRLLEVQYNPSTLQISSSSQETEMENPQGAGKPEIIQQSVQAVNTTLSFDLIVDGEGTRERINGLLGMLGNELQRQVIFCWGSMVFPGEMNGISASYTLFSPTGEPVMGKISMTINQESQIEAAYWTKAFEQLFQRRKNRWNSPTNS